MNTPRMQSGSSQGAAAQLLARCGRAGAARSRSGRPVRRHRAFTVVEMIIAVGALGLLSLGIAHIFRATSDTVRVGRRVSNLNTYATMIERQMREDFSAMTRDGFLVIRHALTPSSVNLHADDSQQPRPRRIDEIVFFANGEFTSLRNPVHPTRSARATEARIYYGHGLRRNLSAPGGFSPIDLEDRNDTAATPRFGMSGPNQYASDWTLLRQLTLLVTPRATLPEQPLGGRAAPVEPAITEQYDNDIQVELQPAASSIFRVLARNEPLILPPNMAVARDESPVQRPSFECGVVDSATTDLAEIRAIVQDAQPPGYSTYPFSLDRDLGGAPLTGGDAMSGGAAFPIDNAGTGSGTPAMLNVAARAMQYWMRQAFPASSDPVGGVPGTRMRYEAAPPDYLGIYGSGGGAFEREYDRTDQLMLSSSTFVPGCTEFIVEWSFGLTYPTNDPIASRRGQVIWHGLPRTVDLDNPANGTSESEHDEWLAWPYDGQVPGAASPAVPSPQALRPAMANDLYEIPFKRAGGGQGLFPVRRELIHDAPVIDQGLARVQYSYFGYVDTARPSEFNDLNGDGRKQFDESYYGDTDPFYEPFHPNPGERRDQGAPQAMPWAWPRMIRITITLVDPTDRSREQTFQFIFDTPGEGGGADRL